MNAPNREARCPSCDVVLPKSHGDPMRAAFAGYSHEAPLLTNLWRFCLDILDSISEPVPVVELCEVVAESQEASPRTVRNLLDAARRDGLVEYEYRSTGTPPRRLAYIRPQSRAGAVA